MGNPNSAEFRTETNFQSVRNDINESPEETAIMDVVGTRIAELVKVSEELVKTKKPLERVLENMVDEKVKSLARVMENLKFHSNPGQNEFHQNSSLFSQPSNTLKSIIPSSLFWELEKKRRDNLFKLLDSTFPNSYPTNNQSFATLKYDNSPVIDSVKKSRDFMDTAKELGVWDLVLQLQEKRILGIDGNFASELIKNAYAKYRRMDQTLPHNRTRPYLFF